MVAHAPSSCCRFAFSASATHHRDPNRNQDAHLALTVKNHGLNGIIVCDGVGSLERSGEAARDASRIAAETLCDRGITEVASAFEAAHRHVLDHLHGEGATTMIILTEQADGIAGHYVGNGAILQLTGAPEISDQRASSMRLQWTNHLLPRTIYEYGRDRMGPVIGSPAERYPTPDHVIISTRQTPQLVVAVTDGILSREQVAVGRTRSGERWEQLGVALLEVLEFGRDVVQRLYAAPDEVSAQELCKFLEERINMLAAAGSLEDDATVGVLLCVPPY